MERDPFFLRFIQAIGIYHATVMIFWREKLEIPSRARLMALLR